MFIRHGESDYNLQRLEDSYGNAILSKNGTKQAKKLVKELKKKLPKENQEIIFIISPLQRDFLTIQPYLENIL